MSDSGRAAGRRRDLHLWQLGPPRQHAVPGLRQPPVHADPTGGRLPGGRHDRRAAPRRALAALVARPRGADAAARSENSAEGEPAPSSRGRDAAGDARRALRPPWPRAAGRYARAASSRISAASSRFFGQPAMAIRTRDDLARLIFEVAEDAACRWRLVDRAGLRCGALQHASRRPAGSAVRDPGGRLAVRAGGGAKRRPRRPASASASSRRSTASCRRTTPWSARAVTAGLVQGRQAPASEAACDGYAGSMPASWRSACTARRRAIRPSRSQRRSTWRSNGTGLLSAPHAGEIAPCPGAGAASVAAALDHLRAQRIAHGVLAIEDDALVARLAAERICLDVCPTSNLLLGVFRLAAGASAAAAARSRRALHAGQRRPAAVRRQPARRVRAVPGPHGPGRRPARGDGAQAPSSTAARRSRSRTPAWRRWRHGSRRRQGPARPVGNRASSVATAPPACPLRLETASTTL